jgi:hypothetical protein
VKTKIKIDQMKEVFGLQKGFGKIFRGKNVLVANVNTGEIYFERIAGIVTHNSFTQKQKVGK